MMPIADEVLQKIEVASSLYYRLILIVAPSGSGKTAALLDVHERSGAMIFNINLELSSRMLDLTERQRILQLPKLMTELVTASQADVVLLDNIELLFDVSFRQDPLRLLQGLSRNKTIVAAWNGTIENGYLAYATPDHPEYRRYSIRDILTVCRNVEK
jgi:hypothetical protein